MLLPIAAAAVALVGGVAAREAIHRRRLAGIERIANTLHINARWWNEQRERSGDLLYVAIGDSSAQGIGASRPGHSYVGLIAAHLREITGRTIRVVNLSVSGARLRDAIEVQLPALAGLKPDFLTVAIGANDIADFDAERFERELEIVYSALPDGAIVADVPSFYFGAKEHKARIANLIVLRVAAKHGLEVAPLHAATWRQTGARYALNQVAADFFHPNDRGYRVWASAFLPVLDRVVAASKSTDDRPVGSPSPA